MIKLALILFYTSLLISFLISDIKKTVPRTFEELISSDYDIIMEEAGGIRQTLQVSRLVLYELIQDYGLPFLPDFP